MNSDQNTNTVGLAVKLKMAIAGLALAGSLAAGAVAVADSDPVSSEGSTETAVRSLQLDSRHTYQSFARGISWQ